MAKKYKKKDLGLGIRALIQSDVSSPAEKKKVVKKLSSSVAMIEISKIHPNPCLLYTSPSPRDATLSRMPSSA